MTAEQCIGAHSAKVTMRLIVNHTPIRITHMGRDFLLVECAEDYPPGEATIVLQVDQSERRWQVRLPDGVSKASASVPIAATA